MTDGFMYKIVNKNDVAVVSFKGRISKDAKEKLEECRLELQKEKIKYTIFQFKEVSNIDIVAFRELSLLQQEARKDGQQIFLTNLSATLKSYLLEKGVIRNNEVKSSLEEVLRIVL